MEPPARAPHKTHPPPRLFHHELHPQVHLEDNAHLQQYLVRDRSDHHQRHLAVRRGRPHPHPRRPHHRQHRRRRRLPRHQFSRIERVQQQQRPDASLSETESARGSQRGVLGGDGPGVQGASGRLREEHRGADADAGGRESGPFGDERVAAADAHGDGGGRRRRTRPRTVVELLRQPAEQELFLEHFGAGQATEGGLLFPCAVMRGGIPVGGAFYTINSIFLVRDVPVVR